MTLLVSGCGQNVVPALGLGVKWVSFYLLIRKISHQNREEAAKAQAILMSLFQTAKLREENPVESVLALAQQAIVRKNVDKGINKKAA